MTAWIVDRLGPDVPLHFSAFHPDWKLLDRPRTPASTLSRARAIARRNGLRHVYTGNVRDPEGETTYCAGCERPVIRRDAYEILDWRLDVDGRCVACRERCPGVFDGLPGAWGRKRLPVRLAERGGSGS